MGRDISKLHPDLQKKIDEFKIKCEKSGLKVGIGECFRTVAEQDALYAQGRTKPGKIVTNARGSSYSSMHQWGVAFDFYRNDGKGAYNTSGQFFQKVGAIGKSVGLEWGGDWKSFKDLPHFQLKQWGSTSATLKKKYGTPDRFIATWKTPQPVTTMRDRKYTVLKNNLWLRNKPTSIGTYIVKMPIEATVSSLGETKGGYLKVQYGKKIGWALIKYLKESK